MRVICSPTLLAHALMAMSHQIKQERNAGILLSATNIESGMLTIVGVGAGGMMGMLHSISATIEEEGDVAVPIEPFAEYIGLLHSPSVTLSQERQQTTPVHVSWIHNGVPLSPFTVESTSTSLAGTTATDRARFKPWIAEDEDAPFPPLACWQSKERLLATIPASMLHQALFTCLPFIPQMKGMLVEVEADHIDFVATTETVMIHYHFPLEHPSTIPCSLCLPSHALRWLKRVLPKDGMITLSFAHDEDSPILILAMNGLILFCRSMKPLLLPWKQLLHATEEGAVTLSRQSLFRALAPFASRSIDDAQVMHFSIEDAMVSMSLVTNRAIALHRSVEIQHVGSPRYLNVLVHPMQLKRIVHALPTTTLTLDIGHFEQWKKHKWQCIGFLRVRSAHITAIMGLSELVRISAHEVSEISPAPTSTQEMSEPVSGHPHMLTAIDGEVIHEKERV